MQQHWQHGRQQKLRGPHLSADETRLFEYRPTTWDVYLLTDQSNWQKFENRFPEFTKQTIRVATVAGVKGAIWDNHPYAKLLSNWTIPQTIYCRYWRHLNVYMLRGSHTPNPHTEPPDCGRWWKAVHRGYIGCRLRKHSLCQEAVTVIS